MDRPQPSLESAIPTDLQGFRRFMGEIFETAASHLQKTMELSSRLSSRVALDLHVMSLRERVFYTNVLLKRGANCWDVIRNNLESSLGFGISQSSTLGVVLELSSQESLYAMFRCLRRFQLLFSWFSSDEASIVPLSMSEPVLSDAFRRAFLLGGISWAEYSPDGLLDFRLHSPIQCLQPWHTKPSGSKDRYVDVTCLMKLHVVESLRRDDDCHVNVQAQLMELRVKIDTDWKSLHESYLPSAVFLTLRPLLSHTSNIKVILNRPSNNPTVAVIASNQSNMRVTTCTTQESNLWRYERLEQEQHGISMCWTLHDLGGNVVCDAKPCKLSVRHPRTWMMGGRGVRFGKERAFNSQGGVVFTEREEERGARWVFCKSMEGEAVKWEVEAIVYITYISKGDTKYLRGREEIQFPLLL